MKHPSLTVLALAGALSGACGGDGDGNGNGNGGGDDAGVNPADFPETRCDDVDAENCVEIAPGDVRGLLTAANDDPKDTTFVLGKGTFEMTNSLAIRAAGVHLIGQGIDETVLDFGSATTQGNGVDVVGDDFLIQDLTVRDATKDGVRVEESDGVVFRRIRTTWSTPSDPSNGAYGIYPVRCEHVLVEDSRAENASDAGLYVGQSRHVIVRRNVVTGNVAGLEIENTQYADVYENTAEDNTAGIVVFDLPGNPVVGRDVRLRDNIIRNNNHENFASGGTVATIPVGTGTFALASRRVEITDNVYANNNTGDIAILSGFVVEGDASKWELKTDELIGDWEDLDLLPGDTSDTVTNYRSENIVVANNMHMGSGTMPDLGDPGMLGLLFSIVYGDDPVDNVLYDSIGESSFDATDPAQNSNDNHICVGGNTDGSFASMDLASQEAAPGSPFFRPEAPFAPFDCTELNGGEVAEVTLP